MGNMNLVTGYRGANHVTADDHGSLYAGIFGEGAYVLNRGSKLAASQPSSNKITIADGDLVMQGRHGRIAPGTSVSLTISNGAQGYKRHDLIVARYSKNASTSVEDLSLVVIKGTQTTGTPADPDCTLGDILGDKDATADFPLYRVVLNGLNIEAVEQMFDVAYFATLDADGKLSVDTMPNKVVLLNSSGKVPSEQVENETFVVMWDGKNKASATAAEVHAAKKNGKICVLINTNGLCAQLYSSSETSALFFAPANASCYRYTLGVGGSVSYSFYSHRFVVTVTKNSDGSKYTATSAASEVHSQFTQGAQCILQRGNDIYNLTSSNGTTCMFERTRYAAIDPDSAEDTTAIIEQILIGETTEAVQIRQYRFAAKVETAGGTTYDE